MVFVIGLTGGIGSGKSTAGEYFKELGVEVIDADVIAKSKLNKGSRFYSKIVEYFGRGSLLKDSSLNRSFIRQEIFTSPEKKVWLEELLHPPIKESIIRSLELCLSQYAILESPLLLETDQYKLTDRVLAIDVPEKLQILRVVKRDGVKINQVESIINAQMERQKRLKLANDIIDNTNSIEDLKGNLKKLHNNYLVLANKKFISDQDGT